MDEGNKNANRPNFVKGRQPHIPSQTIGNAKVQINSEIAIPKLKELARKYNNINDPCGFLTDLRNALGIPNSKGASKYGVITIPKEDGTVLTVSLRITNHQANANNYIKHDANYEYNLSIVIRRKERRNSFVANDNVRLDEFVYYGKNLAKVDSPLSKIVEGLIEYLMSGRYKDKTGVALPNSSPQQVQNIKENKLQFKMNTTKKKVVRLTESDLHRIIKECLNEELNVTYNRHGEPISYENEPEYPPIGYKSGPNPFDAVGEDDDLSKLTPSEIRKAEMEWDLRGLNNERKREMIKDRERRKDLEDIYNAWTQNSRDSKGKRGLDMLQWLDMIKEDESINRIVRESVRETFRKL